MYKKRKLTRNKEQQMAKTKKKATRNAAFDIKAFNRLTAAQKRKYKALKKRGKTSAAALRGAKAAPKPKGFGKGQKSGGRVGAIGRPAKKKATKKKATKKKATTTKKKANTRTLTAAELKQARADIARLSKLLGRMTGGSPDAKRKKAAARAKLAALRKAYVAAAACRLGVQRAKSAGQKVTAKCPKPPSRVGKSAKVLGRQRAQKAGEHRYTYAQLRRNFMNVKEALI